MVFSEPGRSAKTASGRPQFVAAKAWAKANLSTGDVFIVYNLSRLARHTSDALALFEDLAPYGIVVEDFDHDYDFSDPDKKHDFTVKSSNAERENSEKSIDTQRRMREHAMNGRHQSIVAFGYRRSTVPGRSLDIFEPEAAVIRWLFDSYVAGTSISTIAREMQFFDAFADRPRRRANRDGHTRIMNFVREALKRNDYRAQLQNKLTQGELVQGDWEPIITNEQFNRARRRMEGKRNPAHARQLETYFLKGVANCGICGRPMTASPSTSRGKTYSYYHCQKSCKGSRIRVEDAHSQLEEMISAMDIPADIEAMLADNIARRAKEIQRQIRHRRDRAIGLIDEAKMIQNDATRAFLNKTIDQTEKDGVVTGARQTIRDQEEILAGTFELSDDFIERTLRQGRQLLARPAETFRALPEEQKWRFVRGMFPKKIACENRRLRNAPSLAMTCQIGALEAESSLEHPQRSLPSQHSERICRDIVNTSFGGESWSRIRSLWRRWFPRAWGCERPRRNTASRRPGCQR